MAGTNLGQRLASFTLHNRPVLPLRFTPPHHTLTALRQGLEAAEAAAAAVGGEEGVSAAGVLQLHAGPTAAAAGRRGVGDDAGGVCDRLLAYCELNGGLHLADMRWVRGARGGGGGGRVSWEVLGQCWCGVCC